MSFGTTAPSNPTNPSGGEQFSSGVTGSSSSSNSSSFRDPGFIWQAQAPYLEGLYGQGANLAQNFGQFEQQAQGYLGQAGDAMTRLMNPGVNPQLGAYQGEVQRNLERNILPAIGGQAAGFGNYGGGRQGIAEGLAASDANQQVTDMASNLYNADMNRMGQAMQFAPQLGAFGMGIPWYGMQQYSGILGSPTTLQGAAGSESSSSSSSYGENSSYGWDYGGGGGGGGGSFNVGFPTGSTGSTG